MTVPAVFTTVIMANFTMLVAGYAVWRLKRDENDTWAKLIFLFTMLVIGVAAYGMKYPN